MSTAVLEMETTELFEAFEAEFAPSVTSNAHVDEVEVNAAVVAAVAAVVALPLGVVIFICAVCDAKSFAKCLHAVQVYFTPKGC